MSTIDCDRCGTTIDEDEVFEDAVGNTICRDCWQRWQDVDTLGMER